MTNEGIKAKAEILAKCKMNPDVKVWVDTIKDMSEKLAVASFNATGEEAVRAWGMQKAFKMCMELDVIYEAQVNSMARDQIIKPR